MSMINYSLAKMTVTISNVLPSLPKIILYVCIINLGTASIMNLKDIYFIKGKCLTTSHTCINWFFETQVKFNIYPLHEARETL